MGVLLCGFAASRIYFFVAAVRPLISSFTLHGENKSTFFSLQDINFHVAFGVFRWGDASNFPYDPDYVEFAPLLAEWMPDGGPEGKGEVKSTPLPFHVCSDEDFENFYEMDPQTKKLVDKYRKNGLYHCLDKTD